MPDNEFKDLQNFGKVLEKKPEKNNSKKIFVKGKRSRSIKIKPIFLFLGKKGLKAFKKFLKLIVLAGHWSYKKISSVELPRFKNKNKCYKIVETKKQRRNKMIIVRKRVPFEYHTTDLSSNPTNLGTLYYLSFKEGENQETNNEAYTI